MEVEAALQPPSIRLNSNMRKFAIRALKLAPNHPIRQELAKLTSHLANQELTDKPTDKPALQLERIKSSIQHLFDIEDLEPI
jgi:hypothetical protein